ncbi:MAG: hypothetical protein QMD82_06000 [bacterium]|nr:hypothetical protein [bacterium]
MRKLALGIIVVTLTLFSGCNPEDTSESNYQTAYITTKGDLSQGGFDFSEGIARRDSLADMIVEPWVGDNGEPAPGILHNAWGDSTKKIIDLGQVNLEDVIDLDPSGMTPDTTQMDMWTVEKPMAGHAYYITTLENYDAFFFIDSLKVTPDSISYTTDLWIKYIIIK